MALFHSKHLLSTLVLSSALSIPVLAADVIPLPLTQVDVQQQKGISLTEQTLILYSDASLKKTASILAASLKKITGKQFKSSLAGKAAPNAIFLKLDSNYQPKVKLVKQAYKLESNENGVTVVANDNAGMFYGTVTVTQLLPVESAKGSVTNWTLPATTITDAPAYPWRGIMLDVSRYFFSKEYVLRYLDMMAMHKLNVFHWHLIDDCGWRIEIKKYPKLTEIGSQRGSGKFFHKGFYTREDIKEVVAYAKARNIEVVPEIEIPAHTQSALAAYPHLGCFNKELTVPDRHSISPEIYCAGKESTYVFLKDVLDEVTELFPSKYVHIGGDEAKFKRWEVCPDCQKLKKEQGLSSEKQLQGHLTREMEKYLATKGKVILGWAEVLECGVSKKTGIMAWHKPNDVTDGAKAGHPVVSSLVRHTYFDTPESKLPGEPPCATWTPPVTLKLAYNWDPTPKELDPKSAANILGPNGAVWTDRFLHNREVLHDKPGKGSAASEAYVDYLTLPRMAALAEVGWTAKKLRDYRGFTERMKPQYLRYQSLGYNFRVPTPDLSIKQLAQGVKEISISAPVKNAVVRYTIDGSAVTKLSKLVESKLTVKSGQKLKVATFMKSGKESLTYTLADKVSKFAKYGKKIGSWKAGAVAVKTPREHSFDVTGLITANGTYQVSFIYTKGAQGLSVSQAKIVRNDKEIMGKDVHEGFAGASLRKNRYSIKVQGYETGASFKVKAMMCGDNGSDSNGFIFIKKIK